MDWMIWSSGERCEARRSVSPRTARKASSHVRRKASEAASVSDFEGARVARPAMEESAIDDINHSKIAFANFVDCPWPWSERNLYLTALDIVTECGNCNASRCVGGNNASNNVINANWFSAMNLSKAGNDFLGNRQSPRFFGSRETMRETRSDCLPRPRKIHGLHAHTLRRLRRETIISEVRATLANKKRSIRNVYPSRPCASSHSLRTTSSAGFGRK